jgi:allantoinase
MPLNASPPTINGKAFDLKYEAARRAAIVDFGLWGGLVDNNLADLADLHDRGVCAFKAFLCESATDFKRIDDDLLREGLVAARSMGSLVGVHAENEWVTRFLAERMQAQGRIDRKAWGEARPPEAELEAIERAIFWSKATGGRLHIVHISQADGIDAVSAAKRDGVSVTAETCAHYLFFSEEDFVRIGPAAKCAPPLRPRPMVEALWETVLDGAVDLIASDHSPCLIEEKTAGTDNVWKAWGGISGLQSTLPVLMTEGVFKRGLKLTDLVRMTSANPARIFGLYPQKGALQPGADADLVIVDPDARYRLETADLFYKNKHSAYVGSEFRSRIARTIVRGTTVFLNGEIQAAPGFGQIVKLRQKPPAESLPRQDMAVTRIA